MICYRHYLITIKVRAGEASLEGFEVKIGVINYGMEIDGMLGFDFIHAVGLVIDSKELTGGVLS
ncbi:hypothetical protein MKX46_16580 [Paenibacillus sp. FSL P4-0113]|uniref:hypothetical protein n=1 Tax=Paenibacillus sp. FSL P4-0113 TaxID=2921630 RepID=UPI0030FCBE0F